MTGHITLSGRNFFVGREFFEEPETVIYDYELVCIGCREINFLQDGEDITTRPCDDCGEVGTLRTFKEFDLA